MRHLTRPMASLSPEQSLDRISDQRLIDDEEGRAERLASDRRTATRGGRGDYALVYRAHGDASDSGWIVWPFRPPLAESHG
jgi:hypothetical protein